MKVKGVVFAVVLLFVFPVISHAAPITFNVSGQFGTTVFGNLPAADYPYPLLLGGSFDGTFSLDPAVPGVVGVFASFDCTGANVNVRDTNNTIVHTITSCLVRVASGQFVVLLGQSAGPAAVGVPEDLRLVFTEPSLVPSSSLPPVETIVGGTFSFGFSEIDGSEPFTSWDIFVTSATLTAAAPTLTALSPATLWVGLKNSDAVGLRLDLLAEVYVDDTKVGEGQVSNVSGGGSGFNNAIRYTIPLGLTGGETSLPSDSALTLKVSVRRACSGGGHNSGSARLWYNGQPADSGARRDAGSRFDASIDGVDADYFLRSGLALSTTPGTSKQFTDVDLDSRQGCPGRIFKPFGAWSIVPDN